MAVTKMFGASVKRREDPRMITGRANYTDDVRLPGMLSMVILRSPYAHARIKSINVEKARQMPGVVAVYTGKDLVESLAPVPCAWLPPNSDLKVPEYRALAVDTVRYVGDGVAAVVAENRYQAQDAAAAIEVEYEMLPAVVDQEKATQAGAPQLYPDVPNNTAFVWRLAGGDIDAALRDADVVVSQRLINHRLIPTAMETRAAVANYNPGSGELTLWCTSQNPHIHRLLMSAVTGIPETKIRVISTDVGGGFGSKIPFYAGEMIAAAISKDLGRPVKWVEDRRENFVATTHGRDHVDYVDIAAKQDGTITGIRVKAYANMGAYLSTAAPGVPTWLFGLMLSGPYKIPNISVEVHGVLTNTTPTDAYRGAGRPEATYILERMMDLVADRLGMDPVEIRRKNFIAKEEFPYTVATTLEYDSGDYEAALNRALEIVGYEQFRKEQEAARQQGRLLGIGFSTYVEVCGLAPSQAAGAMGFQGGLWESATVRVHPSGKVSVFTGSNPHGQGEETTFAQLVAEELGVPLDDIEIVHGDTGRIPFGMGTYGSRSTAVGGTALIYAARKVRDKGAKIAAHLLEVSPDDIVFDQGRYYVKGAPDRVKTFQEVAGAAYLAWNMPEGVTPGLEETHFFDPINNTYPFGTHVCVVEVDPATGEVKFLRYVAVDDVGNVINPMIVDGQVHGGIAQGLAQAVYETAVYDENGQLLSGSLMDYALPTASMVPTYEVDRTVTPTPVNPMGLKGAGETGTIASTPAVVNAIIDALKPYGITHLDMPLTPQRIWKAIQESQKGS
ncbi:xanthine dehydrogenase family protein molybdopterin-binding subunit [Sphaerobacter thermophilus]|uniref:Aldehyde oxidase and xanthine dehydrogenase molybdopterin binding protein n=3 Tax=Sphaerobacter TaxID=2056 RepID=D1C3L7_SPHTD|nr:molybdopterin cofactor-binding domain-containing protein [Sphaerobacter thermophilus]ACZ38834.1 aldehyde oxidase and xanthine dehydrogenase molybdopterin binding protein [Sphaerobacter thermophilus DSM 20745]